MNEEFSPEISPDLKERANQIRGSFFDGIEANLLNLDTKLGDNGFEVLWAPDQATLCEHILNKMPKKGSNWVSVDNPEISGLLSHSEPVVRLCSIDRVVNHEQEADVLVVNADFAIVEDGSLVFINSKAQDCFNLFSHIVVVLNLDQILLNRSDLSLILQLKKGRRNGFPSDVKILSHSFYQIVADNFITSDSLGYSTSNVNVSVILYENGISEILQDPALSESLYCIHCGRCLEVCPVANANRSPEITPLSPIQIVRNNCYDKHSKTNSIFTQTTLCRMCQEVCPVNIPLTDLLVYEMNILASNRRSFLNKKIHSIFTKRSKLNKMSGNVLRYLWVWALYGKNKQLFNYFKQQKVPFYSLDNNFVEESENSLDTNGIL